MTRRAFTLIELLVVIAIIAILAAILFPVFAQAKAAAKGAASLSNEKQIALATIMYSGDADDNMVRVGNWNSTDPDALGLGSYGYASWALQVDPYQKSVGVNGSPVEGPIVQGSEIARRSGTRFMTYGYNYTYLSPSYCCTWPTPISTISATSVSKPANTVLLTDRAARSAYGSLIWWYGPFTGWMIMGTAETPYCYNDPLVWCTDGWGLGSWYDGSYMPDSATTQGSRTGGVAPRNTTMVNVAFVDGHVKKMAPGNLAAGTNWTPTIQDSAIVVNNASNYLWSTNQP